MHITSSWREIVKLGKSEVIYWLDSFSLDYVEDINYFKLCSTLYRHLKQLRSSSSASLRLEQLTTQVEPTSELSQIAGKLASEQVPTPQVESSTDDVLVDIEFSNLSFRELQLLSIGKFNREPIPQEPITKAEPEPAKYRVLRTHYNKTGWYYGMKVKRLLVRDLATGEEDWVGSNDLDNIQVGDIVIDSTGVGFVVPVNRTAKV